MWSQICRRSCETIRAKSSPIAWVKQTRVGDALRVPKFGVDAAGAGGILPVKSIARVKVADGNRHGRDSTHDKPVNMAAGKRIPLIKFPKRRAGETQGSKAVGRASSGGGRSQAMPSLPSGTASSHPPRATLSEAEVEAVLLGAIFEEPKKTAFFLISETCLLKWQLLVSFFLFAKLKDMEDLLDNEPRGHWLTASQLDEVSDRTQVAMQNIALLDEETSHGVSYALRAEGMLNSFTPQLLTKNQVYCTCFVTFFVCWRDLLRLDLSHELVDFP